MEPTAQRYERLADAFAATVAAVPESAWQNPSPCEGWTARDVVRHVVDTQGMFLGFVGGGLGDIPSVDDDPGAAWRSAGAAVQAELDDPERAGAEFEGASGTSTLEQAVERYLLFDLVIHRWDLARAAGLDDRIDQAELPWARERAEAFGDRARSPGVFGPELEPPPGADDQTRLLAFVGRRAW
jgi:uncharacterized protein (TIGR03086 family)